MSRMPFPSETRSDDLLNAQRHVLERIVRGHPLQEILDELCRIVETQAQHSVHAAILLVDADGERLYTAAAPSIPAAYCRAIDGIRIAPDVGTCCAAAARGEVVVTRDLATDPGWATLRQLPLELGLRGAWSMPILTSSGSVLGTFGTYFTEAREPNASERRLVEVLASTAALAIERERADAQLRASGSRHRFLVELAAATQPLSEPADVMETTARMVTELLDADRCAYAEVEDERVFVITGDCARDVPSIVGRWPVESFGPECVSQMLAGEPFVVHDVQTTPSITAEFLPAYRATTIGAVICVPLHKSGRFTAAMAVHSKVPRRWTAAEVELVTLVVARCWEALERARVTRTLQQSEARYRAIVEASPECVKVVAPDGTLLQMNRAGLRMVGASSESEALGRSVYDVIAPEHRARFRAFNERVCRGEEGTLTFDVVGLRGARRSMETTAVPLPASGGGFTQLAVTRDVTARVLAEERLSRAREREREQARLLEKVAQAGLTIHACDSLDGVLHVVTEQARAIVGAHQAVTSVFADGDAPALQCQSLSDAYRARREREGSVESPEVGIDAAICRLDRPLRLTQPELESHPLWRAPDHAPAGRPGMRGWLAVPLITRDGAQLGLVQLSDKLAGDFSDIDEAILVQLAQIAAVAIENARLYEQLRLQDRRKNEFLATLAHELRNPLAPIRTGLEVLRAGADHAQVNRAHAMMARQLGHMVRMIDDLLDISRVTLGKVALQTERIDFRDAVGSALETTRSLFDAAQHTLHVQLPDAPLMLDADPTRLTQVLANLMNNAAKYTPPGGRVALTAQAENAQLVVRVSDTGVGIPPDMIASVFEMFTQVGRTIERAQGGLGIGLTLVRRLVEMHGGSVACESAGIGRGTTFVIRLPLAEAASAAPARAQADTVATASTLRILVVDDNLDAAESLGMLLELSGHVTKLAHTGPDAVAAAFEFAPDVVFLDIGLPGLNGYEVAKRIRAHPTLAQPVLIALTGWGSEEDVRNAHAAGFDEHLVKPFDTSRIAELLSPRSARA